MCAHRVRGRVRASFLEKSIIKKNSYNNKTAVRWAP